MAVTSNGFSRWEKARSTILRFAQRYEGVGGVDYGYVYKNGIRTRRLGVRFHVRRKLALEEIAPTQVLPSSLHGLPCDVLQASYSLCGSPHDACDPIQPGISVGNFDQHSTGTLGLVVRDRLTGREAILSNWHVLCGSTKAVSGNLLVQPGPRHIGSRSPRVVARLERWLPLSTGLDAAIGLLEPGINWRQELFDSVVAVSGVTAPKAGMELKKFGSTSNLTHGVVDGMTGAYLINYSGYGDVARFMDGIILRGGGQPASQEISLEGDSGAVWVDGKGRAVALLFAGEDGLGPTAEYSLAHPIEKVLNLLQVDPIS